MALKSQYNYFQRKGNELLSNQPRDFVDVENLIRNTLQ